MKKVKSYPKWACFPCGQKHGSGKTKTAPEDFYGECEVCGKNGYVADPSHYGHFKQWFK